MPYEPCSALEWHFNTPQKPFQARCLPRIATSVEPSAPSSPYLSVVVAAGRVLMLRMIFSCYPKNRQNMGSASYMERCKSYPSSLVCRDSMDRASRATLRICPCTKVEKLWSVKERQGRLVKYYMEVNRPWKSSLEINIRHMRKAPTINVCLRRNRSDGGHQGF